MAKGVQPVLAAPPQFLTPFPHMKNPSRALLPVLTLLSMTALLSTPAPAASSRAFAAPGDVLVVDASGAGDFLDIQDAVDASSPDDTLLIMDGAYSGFSIDNKGLALAADSVLMPRVTGLVTLSGLTKGEGLSLSGLHLKAGFIVTGCKGTVVFTDCTIVEPNLADAYLTTPEDEPGMHQVLGCEDVVFSDSSLIGRDGESTSFMSGKDGADGENGLWVMDSTVSLYSCVVQGGEGGLSEDSGGLGCTPAYRSNGGHGICARSNSLVYMDGTQPVGGLRGEHWCCGSCDWDEKDGQAVYNDGTASVLSGNDPFLHLDSPLVVRESDPMPLTLTGPQGARSWMVYSPASAWRYLGLDLGILHLRSNQLKFAYLGKVPGSGSLQISITPPLLPPGEEALRVYVQPFALFGGSRLLGNARSVIVIDDAL